MKKLFLLLLCVIGLTSCVSRQDRVFISTAEIEYQQQQLLQQQLLQQQLLQQQAEIKRENNSYWYKEVVIEDYLKTVYLFKTKIQLENNFKGILQDVSRIYIMDSYIVAIMNSFVKSYDTEVNSLLKDPYTYLLYSTSTSNEKITIYLYYRKDNEYYKSVWTFRLE